VLVLFTGRVERSFAGPGRVPGPALHAGAGAGARIRDRVRPLIASTRGSLAVSRIHAVKDNLLRPDVPRTPISLHFRQGIQEIRALAPSRESGRHAGLAFRHTRGGNTQG
jgi:hypothetical protein